MAENNKSRKLLIVDDELTVRESLKKWFIEDGFKVESAEDAYKALEKLEAESYGIVLLDIRMPGMDGLELQNKIKEIDPDTIAIIMTAYASVDTAITALKQGAFDYIIKPFNPEDLSRLVHNASKQLELKNENSQLKQKIRHLTCIDDIIGENIEAFNDYTGERLAINEFNNNHDTKKFSEAYYLTCKKNVENWYYQIRILHNFSHSRYNDFISKQNKQLPIL